MSELRPVAPAAQTIAEADHRTQRVTLTKAPRLISAILLDRPWDYPLIASSLLSQPDSMCCFRHHFVAQLDLLVDGESCMPWMASVPTPLVFLLDAITLGFLPTPYPGLCSVAIGVRARLLTRLRYRIEGTGVQDLGAVVCCPAFAAWQIQREMEMQGLLYSPACFETMR
jgi:hypothetical protein